MRVILKDSVYIPIKQLKQKHVDKFVDDYMFRFYDERACRGCEYKPDRHCETCDTCPAYKAGIALGNVVKEDGKKYLKLPHGDRRAIVSRLERMGYDDITIKKKYPKSVKIAPIKFTGELRDYQPTAVAACIKKRFGVLEAPPRSGKCITGNSLVMTTSGLVAIRSLFPAALHSDAETHILDRKDVATLFGAKTTDGLYSKVVDETIRVTTNKGYTVRGTVNHPVRVARAGFKVSWVPLEEVRVGDYIAISRKEQWLPEGNDLLPFTFEPRSGTTNLNTYDTPTKLNKKLARLLGYLVANGSLGTSEGARNRFSFCTENERVMQDYIKCLTTCFPGIHYTMEYNGAPQCIVGSAYLSQWLQKACGLAKAKAAGKEIPSVILSARKELMLEYLGAYISCDSWVHGAGVQLCTASKKMATQLHVLLTYLGVIGELKRISGRATNGSGIHRNYYSITLLQGMANKLLGQIKLRKPSTLRAVHRTDTTDSVPFLTNTLRSVREKYLSNNGWQLANGNTLKNRLSDKIVLDEAGFNEERDTRVRAAKVNTSLLKALNPKLAKGFSKLVNPDIFWEHVTSVKQINGPTRVYDVSIPDGRQFVANGIVNHNTVMATALIVEVREKTIIIANQRDWLMGFYETFVGSDTQKPLTNIKKSRIGFPKKYKEFLNYDICLVTPQMFHTPKGRKLLEKIKDMFGVAVLDEAHTSPATQYAKVVSALNVKRFIALTGTPDRKDGRWVIAEKLIGPVAFQVKIERNQPRIKVVETNYKPNLGKHFNWTNMVTRLEQDPARLKLIAKWALKDASNGHMILIPISRITAVKALVGAINRMAGKTIAASFFGGTPKKQRDELIQKARKYKIKVLVGQARLLTTGINIPRASMLYEVTPSANIPQAIQRFARVLTPFDGKPLSCIRYFLDPFPVRASCIKKEWLGAMLPKFKPIVSDKVRKRIGKYFAENTNRRREEADDNRRDLSAFNSPGWED